MRDKLSHLDGAGQPQYVDISDKNSSHRVATAQSIITLPNEIIQLFEDGDIKTAKGPIFHTANLAGIMACKQTSNLIPLCHPLPINKCKIDMEISSSSTITIRATVATDAKTGVEMEALTAATVAALTIYDMCKGFSHNIEISHTKLIMKTGGNSDFYGTP